MFGWSSRTPRDNSEGSNTLPDGRVVDLVLYKFDSCPFCTRVYRAIDRLGVAVAYRDIRTRPEWRRELVDRTGRSTVPCLFIDGEAMFESLDIVAWLEQTFGEPAG